MMKRVLARLGLIVALGATPVIASQPSPSQPPAATDGFVPVTDLPPEEELPAAPLVVGAYAFIWVAVLFYVGLLWRRLGVLQKDLDALKRSPSR